MMKKKSRIYIIWLMNLCLITTVVAIFVWYESVPDVSPEKVLKTYMFDLLYPKLHNEKFPYVADDNLGIGAVYHIPKTEFENVIMEYFNIDSDKLQKKTIYDYQTQTYEYKPRGFYEIEYPEYPYSEVVGYTEHSDGTITLNVHVVYPYAGDSDVYMHDVTVRPLSDGRVQYVSNYIVSEEENNNITWHTPRLTEDEWNDIYGGQ